MDATTIITHTITGRKGLRHTPHHHRGPALNKTHAVCDAGLRVRGGAATVTVCGAAVTVSELCEVVGADGGPVYNCRPAATPDRVTCKDCRRKLGI